MTVQARVSRILPPRFAEQILEDYVPQNASQKSALAAAYRMAAGVLDNLVLVGSVGLGKTHLAAGVVRALVERDEAQYSQAVEAAGMDTAPRLYPVPRWLNVADACVELRFEMNAPADDRGVTEKVRRAKSHPALVVFDDLGREKISDWTGELIYALVNARYEAQLPTLVTSNLTPKELVGSSYWAVISRLAETGELVKMEGADWRFTKGRKGVATSPNPLRSGSG